jgi:peptide/nickel transport system substrate-binding protein
MARRIRWQIVITVLTTLVVTLLLGRLALRSATGTEPLPGGVYSEAVVGRPVQPIPLLNNPLEDPVGRDMAGLLFDGLMRIGRDGRIEPALADGMPQVDAREEVYTFNLRQDARWHDGTPFTADDVLFTVRAIQEEEFGDPAALAFWQQVLVDRIDDYTVRFTLDSPYAPFLSLARLPILPAHVLRDLPPEQWADSAFARQPIGTGPYRLEELSATSAMFVAHERYFGGRPLIDRIEWQFFETVEAALGALSRGEVQAFASRVTGQLPDTSLPATLREHIVPLDEYAVLTFNVREAPFDTATFRQALAYGLDKDVLIDTALNGLASSVDTPILPGWWAYDPEAEWYPADQELAGRLLGEQGYEPGVGGVRFRDGQPLRLELITDENPRRLVAANEIARQWGQIGVEVEVVPLAGEALLERLRAGEFSMALHSWVRLGVDPDVFALWHSSQATDGLNYAGLEDPAIDELLELGRQERDEALRAENYQAFQERWIELAPSITLYRPVYRIISDERLGGLGFDEPELAAATLLAGPEDRYREVISWFVNSARRIDGRVE